MEHANSNTRSDAANSPSVEQPLETQAASTQAASTQAANTQAVDTQSVDTQSANTPPVGENAAADQSDAGEPAAFTADQAKLVLRRVKDPELNLNIVDLGLIYDVIVVGNDVRVDMSLTSPGCPSGPEIMGEAEKELRTLPGIGEAVVNLVWSPAWTPERIEPRVRAYMGF